MAPVYLRVFRRRRSMLLLLLIVLLSSGFWEILGVRGIAEEDYSGERHKTGERKLQEQRLSNLSIHNIQLLKYRGDVLSSRDDRAANAWYRILAIALSPDEQTIYYSEKLMTPSVDHPSFETNLVKKAEPVGPSNMTYNITYVAGPWFRDTNYGQYASFRTSNWASIATNGTDVRGLLMLNDTALALSSVGSNGSLWALDVISGSGKKLLGIRMPMQIVRHPWQDALFVSTDSLITKVPLSVDWQQSDDVAGSIHVGYVDSTGQDARFQDPMIGPQAISRDGRALYIADYWNNAVRRVDTVTRFTETIAGSAQTFRGAPRFLSPEGGFDRARSLALDSDNCNLFVSERDRGRIHWLRFNKPNGNVTAIDTVATLLKPNGSPVAIMSLYLTKSDTYLYAGTGDGQILKLEVNVSALLCPSEGKESSSSSSMAVIGVSVGLVLGGIVVLAVAVYIYRQRCCCGQFGSTAQSPHWSKAATMTVNSNGHLSLPTTTVSGGTSVFSETDAEWLAANSITAFPWSEIEKALTEGNCLTGKSGGYGDVYRCSLMVGKTMTDVAVKVMRGDLDAVKHRQFLAEVNTLSHVRHKNLCKLLGYCVEESRCVLLYPFVSGGSLYDRLHRTKPRAAAAAAALEMQQQQQRQQQQSRESSTVPGHDGDGWEPLKWTERLVIARQLATCFRYLHHELEQPIIHRDIKSQNVLVDGKWKSLQAYVCDFGLAKPGNVANVDNPTPSGKTTVFTLTQGGTPGYMAPEYIYDSKLTLSSDVFAFGVVLLELVSAKRAIIRLENGDPMPLYSWVRQNPLESILDPHLQDSLMPGENVVVCDLLNLALQCTDERISRRPSMVDIARAIEEMLARPVH